MMLMVAAAIGLSLYFGQARGGIFNTMADYNAYLVPGVIVAYGRRTAAWWSAGALLARWTVTISPSFTCSASWCTASTPP